MQPGDLVRIRPSDKLVGAWREFADRGTRMRIRMIDRARMKGTIRVQPENASVRTLQHYWFDEVDLIPIKQDVDIVAEAIKRLRGVS